MLVSIVTVVACGGGARNLPADENAGRFWRWFERNAARIAMAHPDEVLASEEVYRELHRVDEDLAFDLPSATAKGERQFVVTAGGKREAFPAVERLVAAAPAIPGWRIVAFQQRVPRTDRLVLQARHFTLDTERILYHSEPEGDRLSITLYLEGGARANQELPGAVDVLLERLLGELDLATQIGLIDYRPAIDAPPDARPLRYLRREIDRHKAQRPESQSSRRRTTSASLPASYGF